jgi:dTDP-4-dehydrorhamnose reductase
VNEAIDEQGSLLVLGAQGLLGRELVEHLRQTREQTPRGVVAWDLEDLDIRDRKAVLDAIERLRPAVVVNAAAYTNVDACETNVELATAVNAHGPGYLAEACTRYGTTLVQFGSDYIFDGTSDRPYRPDDAPNPLSVYGRSKWEGEQAVAASGCRHLIVRTAWLFGLYGRSFVDGILCQAGAGTPLRVVDDQVGSPTFARDLADAVGRLLKCQAYGIVHFVNAGQCSWYELARELVRQAALGVPVEPATSTSIGQPARRPAYSVLDWTRYRSLTGHEPAPWQDALRRYLEMRGR